MKTLTLEHARLDELDAIRAEGGSFFADFWFEAPAMMKLLTLYREDVRVLRDLLAETRAAFHLPLTYEKLFYNEGEVGLLDKISDAITATDPDREIEV